MPPPTPLLDIVAARRIAQRHVGEGMEVIACWQRPEGLYVVRSDEHVFYFAVIEPNLMRVGGMRHIAVDRKSGAVSELGMFGE